MRELLSIALIMPCLLQAQVEADRLLEHRPAPFDAQWVALDDERRAANGDLALYARSLTLGIGSDQAVWTVEGNEQVARLLVTSPGARAMELFLDGMDVPAGAYMRISDVDGRELHGAVPIVLLPNGGEWATPLVAGDRWVLEYREPLDAERTGRFRIPVLGHAYRDVEAFGLREGNCHVNVACQPEANGWDGPINATVRISVVTPQGAGWCTGTLVNNVRQDCAPFVLTAWHCGRTSSSVNFGQYKFYFNFQYATCAGGAYSTSQFLTGASLQAHSDDYDTQFQGLGGSDFMLLRTHADVPAEFNAYWAGWDATSRSTVTDDGVCIHHPTGAPKRISSYTQTLTTGHPMASSGLMSHYRLRWASTPNGFGITEQGSSGSGLFKAHPQAGPVLIGTLTGSSSGMTCVNNGGISYFGKMSYHWTNNPNSAALKLNRWLDPDATGALVLAGSEAPCFTSVEEERASNTVLNLYPNPASDQVWFGGLKPPAVWTVHDAAGRSVAQGRIQDASDPIDIAGLLPGSYTINVLNNGGAPSRASFIIAR